jgi:hypothetical protein
MVAVELDGNYIDAECMKSRKTTDLIKAYQNIHQPWTDSQVIHTNCHVLDNEAPCELKAAIRSNGCTVKLTPPDIDQHNNAKQAIQTFKSHFISILSGVDNSFPINEWDSLLPQAILTLNLLRNANVAPKISAYMPINTARSTMTGCHLRQSAVQYSSMSKPVPTHLGQTLH